MLARIRASMAAAILAAGLSFGLAAQPAQALTIPPVVPPVVVGSTPAAAGGAVAACVASVVCGTAVAAAAISVGLYATRNTWVPMLGKLFSPDEVQTVPRGSGATIGFLVHSPVQSNAGRSLTLTLTNNTASDWVGGVALNYVCSSGGVLSSWVASSQGGLISAGTSNNYTWNCAVGSVMLAAFTSDHATSTYRDPEKHLYWSSPSYSDSQTVYRATAECVGDGGVVQTITVDYQGNDQDGFMIPSCLQAGAGNLAKSVDVAAKFPGRTDFRNVWSVDADPAPLYPDCDPTMGVGCVLAVWVDGTACLVGDARCLDWQSHSASRLQCKWGSYSVPLAKCDMLERAYQTGGASITDENVDGNPSTGTGSSPGTGTGSFPTEAPIPSDVPAPAPGTPGTSTGGPGCWPTGSARWNPLEWVQLPVQCALSWAFIPDAGVQPSLDRFGAAWDGSDIGVWVSDVSGAGSDLGAAVGANDGCAGPVWTIPLGGQDYAFRPLDACTAPMSTIAPFVKAGVGALVVLAGIRAVARPITSSLSLPGVPGSRDGVA